MTNPRDTGRYDAFTDSYVDQQVRVDFAWGNIPMQPNDDRGMAPLDPELDSHIIAASQYEGFPAFVTGAPYDDTVPNATMPNFAGMNLAQIADASEAAGFYDYEISQTNTTQPQLDGICYAQNYLPGAVLNVTDVPRAYVYHLIGTLVPNIAGMPWPQANSTITGAGFTVGSSSYSSVGGNDTNVNKVKSQTPTAGTLAAPGSTVSYVLYELPTSGPLVHMEYHAASNRYFFYPTLATDYVSPSYVGRTITIANFVANPAANGNYVIDEIVADNAWNTGGQKIWLQRGSFNWSGSGNSANATWTLVP